MERVFEAATAADGVCPVNESGQLVLEGSRPGVHVVDGPAEAVVDNRDGTIMLAVHPEHRRRGHGTALLSGLLDEHPAADVWAFGSLPGSAELAARVGLVPRRTLLRMTRPLAGIDAPAPDPRIGPFHTDDAAAVVAVNAAAFAHHPEQGRLTLDEFRELAAQDWFDPEGLLVARDGDEVVGFHWTKRHGGGLGEVYVIAVAPGHEGKGLGRSLLAHGLQQLAARGDETVELYVEASEARVVAMYEAAGFTEAARDTMYGRNA